MSKPNISITTSTVNTAPRKLKVLWVNPNTPGLQPNGEIWMLPKAAPFRIVSYATYCNPEGKVCKVVKSADYVKTWLKKTFKKNKDYWIINPKALAWEQDIAVTEEVLIMMELTFRGQ